MSLPTDEFKTVAMGAELEGLPHHTVVIGRSNNFDCQSYQIILGDNVPITGPISIGPQLYAASTAYSPEDLELCRAWWRTRNDPTSNWPAIVAHYGQDHPDLICATQWIETFMG